MLLKSIMYPMRWGLVVQGHDEEESNLSQFLKCRAEGIEERLKHGSYQSHDIK